jgi:CTP:molybdopterin cytidylyltransferase MocA
VLRAAAADPGCRDLPFRQALARHATAVREIAVEDAGVIRDFDDPDDLAAWRREGDAT